MAEQADTIGDWRCCLVVSISFFFCDFVVGVAWVSLWSEDLLVGECISHDICADEVRFGRFVIWIKWTILLGLLNLHEFARYFVENTSNEYVNVCWLYSNVNSFHWTLGPLDPWGRLAETPRNVWVLVSRVLPKLCLYAICRVSGSFPTDFVYLWNLSL